MTSQSKQTRAMISAMAERPDDRSTILEFLLQEQVLFLPQTNFGFNTLFDAKDGFELLRIHEE